MIVSRVVFGSLVTAIVAMSMGCKVEVSTKNRFVEQNVTREDTTDWAGQEIYIDIKGVGVAINGGVNVDAVAGATKVAANARMLAMAFDNQKPDADQSIIDAKNTYKITNTADRITVECGHGNTHGESSGGESGCELTNIVVPAGTADKPLKLTVLGGNGTMTLQLRNATIINVGANNQGDISAEIPSSVGASVSLVAPKADDVAVTLPSSWSADEVILQADADKIVNAFADAKLGAGAGGRGTPGTGLKSLKLTSESFAGSTGTVTLR